MFFPHLRTFIRPKYFRNDDLKALGVDDSKKLTEEQREELLQKVIEVMRIIW